jgi:hypothetical protein
MQVVMTSPHQRVEQEHPACRLEKDSVVHYPSARDIEAVGQIHTHIEKE